MAESCQKEKNNNNEVLVAAQPHARCQGGCEKGDGSIEVDGGLSSVSCKAAESEGQALLSGQQYKKTSTGHITAVFNLW